MEARQSISPDASADLQSAPVSEHFLAARWGKSVRTLQRWRAERYGPAYLRVGGTVLYRMSDVLAFEDAVRRNGESG
jgi:hypothetical protein